jgi:hypothetical protein
MFAGMMKDEDRLFDLSSFIIPVNILRPTNSYPSGELTPTTAFIALFRCHFRPLSRQYLPFDRIWWRLF